ncbi:MAG: ParB N-terminal domain-containing protein [Clostridia bacterium]|nr:ParB N-terminal domain-containing protein [Clostridia bacterium]
MKHDSLRPRATLPSPRLKCLPLSAIVPAPFAVAPAPHEEVMLLAESVRRHGLLQPIGVCRKAGFPARYELLFGYRRFLACRALFLKRVPCLVFPDSRDGALYSLCENFQRAPQDTALLFSAAARLCVSAKDLCSRLPIPCPEEPNSAPRRDISLFLEEDSPAAAPAADGQKKRGIVRDARLIANSIERAVCQGRDAGVCVEIQKVRRERELVYHIRLPISADCVLVSAEEVSRAA